MIACPACGRKGRDGARFCDACGHALPALADREVRKRITIVFCDMVGSTPLAEQLDPETVAAVMARYFETTRVVVERWDGTVEKFIGDAVLAVFGVPELHEDDALRGLGAASEIRAEIRRLSAELEDQGGVGIDVRIGVNTGEVVVRPDSPALIGDAVNVAARLEQSAASGEILVAEETGRAAGIDLGPGPPLVLELKGKRAPVRAWLLERAVVPSFRRLIADPVGPLVGRQAELQALIEVARRAFADRKPALVTVLGAAGIGKSRLVAEVVGALGAETQALTGQCPPLAEAAAFRPLADIVRQATGGDLESGLSDLLSGHPDRAHAVERLADLVGLSGAGEPGQALWAARALLEALAQRAPLVVVFDDLHWARPGLLHLIEYVRAFAGRVPLVVLCQARPELLELRPDWIDPRVGGTTVRLGPLMDTHAAELLDARDGASALRVADRRRVLAAAEGNPLFLEQMVAMLTQSAVEIAVDAVPPRIEAILGARIDRLPRAERAVLEAAAVQGAQFHRGAVEAMLDHDERPTAAYHLLRLVRGDLLRPSSSEFDRDDGFRFSHILLRDTVYTSIPRHRRSELHVRYAEWLCQAAGLRLAEYEHAIGHHFEQAHLERAAIQAVDQRGRDLAAEAARYFAAAAHRAYAGDDVAAATTLFARAAALAQEPAIHAELLLMLSAACDFGGQPEQARTAAADALAAACRIGDARLDAWARNQVATVAFHTEPSADAGTYADTLNSALAAFEAAGDEYGLALTLRRLGWVSQVQGRFADAIRLLERAAERARRVRHDREERLALAMIAESLWHGPTPAADAIDRCEAILAQGRGGLLLEAEVCSALACLHALRGEFSAGRSALKVAWEAMEPLGERHAMAQGANFRGRFELLAGRPEHAEQRLRGGLAELREIGDTSFLAPLATTLAEALLAQDRVREALEATEIAERAVSIDDRPSQSAWRAARARALACDGHLPAALALADDAVVVAGQTDALHQRAMAHAARATVLRHAGRDADAALDSWAARRLLAAKGALVAAKPGDSPIDFAVAHWSIGEEPSLGG